MKLSESQILEIIQSKEWDVQGFNGYPLYLMCAATESGWLVRNEFGAGYTHFFFFFSHGRTYMYYDRQDLENICEGYYKKITSREQLEELIAGWKLNYQALRTDTAYNESMLYELPVKKLMELMKRLCDRLINAVKFAHAIEGITYGSEKRLRHLLNKKGDFNEQEFGLLCSPVHPSFLSEAQKQLGYIKSLCGKERVRATAAFIEEYGWIENTYLGARKFSKRDVDYRVASVKENFEISSVDEINFQKEELSQRLVLSPYERFIVTTIELSFHWQDERKKYILQTIGALEPVVKAVSKRLGVDANDLKFMNPDEISEFNLLRRDFHGQLKRRRENSACFSIPGKNFVFTNADFDFLWNGLHVTQEKGEQEIRGVVASPGIVKGRVKVCESISDIDKVQYGEVLVASMTRPEYLKAMQRAVAFVTDEGGITCHAAIIAREMKKPCIIGTKIATKILKDGNVVEVDANKGIISFGV